MPVNLDKPQNWKSDIAQSVDMYNDWFMKFAPKAFRKTRINTTTQVEQTLRATRNLTSIRPEILRKHPGILPTLRMSTCPPIAVDRLIGIAGVSSTLVESMENDKRIPPRMEPASVEAQLQKICEIIQKMADPDIFVWIERSDTAATETEIHRAATIVADRLCGAVANPIIRNAQEKRQLNAIKTWLEARGYKQISRNEIKFNNMPPGTFSFRMNVPVKLEGGIKTINIPIDVVIKPHNSSLKELPIFFEAKSAGDFTNTNKRRKEEAMKMAQLRSNYGTDVRFNLFLCGYFDSGYLGYEAAEGIDWVWEHRIDDLAKFGI